jgi:hypothetical protein
MMLDQRPRWLAPCSPDANASPYPFASHPEIAKSGSAGFRLESRCRWALGTILSFAPSLHLSFP